jgi:hypothetical protein
MAAMTSRENALYHYYNNNNNNFIDPYTQIVHWIITWDNCVIKKHELLSKHVI